MGRYFRRRLLTAIPVFFGITFLVFVLLSLSPADIQTAHDGVAAVLYGLIHQLRSVPAGSQHVSLKRDIEKR